MFHFFRRIHVSHTTSSVDVTKKFEQKAQRLPLKLNRSISLVARRIAIRFGRKIESFPMCDFAFGALDVTRRLIPFEAAVADETAIILGRNGVKTMNISIFYQFRHQ